MVEADGGAGVISVCGGPIIIELLGAGVPKFCLGGSKLEFVGPASLKDELGAGLDGVAE